MVGIIVVHGAPGAGKSTQCRRIEEIYSDEHEKVRHLSVGDRLRKIRNREIDSQFSDNVNDPDAPSPLDHYIVNGIVFEFISNCKQTNIVIIDGFPRFVDAINPFMQSIEEGGHALLGCINLCVSQGVSSERLGIRGIRKGEREFIVDFKEARWIDYLDNTRESVSRFREFTKVVDVDGEKDFETVWQTFNEAFIELINNIDS